jgi:hypothetical protein
MAGSSIGRTTDFESVGWRFEPSPASFITCAAARVKLLLRNCSKVPGRVQVGATTHQTVAPNVRTPPSTLVIRTVVTERVVGSVFK